MVGECCRRQSSCCTSSDEPTITRFDADRFRPFGEPRPHAVVAIEPVEPLGSAEPVGDLLAVHEAAGIELRLMPNLWIFWDAVVASTIEFSGIRLANARPRVPPA
jgi:tRNA(Met) C34 N-acetyltransferase TmcA